ncbi:Trk system potassium transporter TrkA [Rubrobacter indicoceani]|uniref:Trk system potassium transporter TrkA n=1 Tax=Rubrobacter indicoceani TaxID=2051957 RepID=UPI0013C4E16D|nr:Trk system potassium transporter TrkA [Rubrobacter indicoceani]
MRTVVIGAGEVGFTAAKLLSNEGHQVVLVETDGARVEHASENLDALVIHGNGASPRLLSEAGVDHSDLLVAASNSDEVNIIACLSAKSRGVKQTVARLHNSDYYDPRDEGRQEMLGIDHVIHTEEMATRNIRDALLVPGAANIDSFADGRIGVAEVILDRSSPAVGKTLKEIELPEHSLMVGVVRNGEALVPGGDTRIEVQDHVLLVSGRESLSRVVRAVATDTAPVRDVIIYGGGRVGLSLALALERERMSVKVIERDPDRARVVASELRRGLVLNSDALSEDFLLQERVDKTDAFVAVTGDDRANMLAAMYAGRLGARSTIAGLSSGEFAPLSDALGVDVTISPRVLASEAILRFVRRGEVVNVALLQSNAEMIELRVPQNGCRVTGRPLSEVSFPKGAIVGALLRDDEVVIPRGADSLRPGDDAVIFTIESAVDEVENLFAP